MGYPPFRQFESSAKMGVVRKVLATAALVVVMVTFVALGRWQWDVAHSNPAGEPLTGTQPFTDVVEPEQYVPLNAIGATVTARGTLRSDLLLRVPYRNASGLSGNADECWAIEPLQLSNGLAITIVTGVISCSSSQEPEQIPNMLVTGILQPPDDIPTDTAVKAPFLPSVSTDLLIEQWPFQIYDGYILSKSITPLVPNPPGSRLDLQNAAYAIQWWLFCGFAVFVWWRIVRPISEQESISP